MAYQSGASSSLTDLLTKLRLFAEGLGWTTTAANDTTWAFRSPQSGDFTLRLSTNVNLPNVLEMHGSTGNITGVLNPLMQPNNSNAYSTRGDVVGLFRPGSGGPYTRYHFFGTMQYLHLALEVQSGAFAHMFVGRLNKKGMTYEGGEYLQASHWRFPHGEIRPINSGSPSGNWTPGFGSPSNPWQPKSSLNAVRVTNLVNYPGVVWASEAFGIGKGPFSDLHPDQALSATCKCDYLHKPLIVPNRVLIRQRPVTEGSRLLALGETPDFGITDISRNSPGDILIYGEDRWMVFPAYRRGSEPYNYSIDVGYAYLVRD